MKSGRTRVGVLGIAILVAAVATVRTVEAQTVHGKEYWRGIAAKRYEVPEGEKAFGLAKELSGYLKSSDAELRDDLAYSILAEWILHKDVFSKDELLALEEEWRGNLKAGIGDSETGSVLGRSFSALCLAAIAERELKTPFLGEARYHKLLAAAESYLKEERDLRGFDPVKGWIHATAHTADLLAALVRHPLFTKQDQAAVLGAIWWKLEGADVVFAFREQDRLANVLAAMAGRTDFDLAGFREWLIDIDRSDQAVWRDSPPKLEGLQRFENDTYFLSAFVARVSLGEMTSGAEEAKGGLGVVEEKVESKTEKLNTEITEVGAQRTRRRGINSEEARKAALGSLKMKMKIESKTEKT